MWREYSMYQYSNMVLRLSAQISIFGLVFFVSKPRSPVLEYWYIDRGLFGARFGLRSKCRYSRLYSIFCRVVSRAHCKAHNQGGKFFFVRKDWELNQAWSVNSILAIRRIIVNGRMDSPCVQCFTMSVFLSIWKEVAQLGTAISRIWLWHSQASFD